MKRYQVFTTWNADHTRHGFQNAPHRRMAGPVEDIEARLLNMGENIHYRIKDLETKEIVREGHTELNPVAYGY